MLKVLATQPGFLELQDMMLIFELFNYLALKNKYFVLVFSVWVHMSEIGPLSSDFTLILNSKYLTCAFWELQKQLNLTLLLHFYRR